MRIFRIILAASLGLCFALPAAAQYIGVLQSAETYDVGTYKLMVAPIITFGKKGADNELGIAARGGYAFTDRFDAEAKLGFFENSTFVGVDGEIWILNGEGKDVDLDFSLTGGVHGMFGKKGYFDTIGIEVTPMFSSHLTENLELYGALDVSFEFIQDAPPSLDDSFTRLHLVPGFEYRVSNVIDLDGEIGIALNNESTNYAGASISFYFR
jgi:hypothetical protein